ncbi:MAG: glycoside hydrolase family 2 TIM barrel-domain containing protein [Halanaeroarchaeum sp.]
MPAESGDQSHGGPQVSRRGVLAGMGAALGTTLPLGSASAETTEAIQADAPSITLTPRPDQTDVGGTTSLNATWDFALSSSETPPGTSSKVTTPDLSSEGNDATLQNGAKRIVDPDERAIDLSGGGYVAVGDANSLDFTSPGFTLQVTFKYAGNGVVLSKGNDQYSFGVWDGTVSFWTRGEGGWPTLEGGNLTRGRWYTVTVVVGKSNVRLFVDGVEAGSMETTFSSIPHTDSPLHLGYNSGNGNFGSPVVDSLKVFDTGLSAKRVRQGFDSIPASAAAWLPIDSVSNGVTPDESGNGNDGKIQGDAPLVAGEHGAAVDVSGDALVSVPHDDSLNFTSPGFTLRTRVRYDGGGGVVLDKGTVGSGTEQFGLGIYDGTVSFWMQTAGGNWPTVEAGSLSTGEWHTITVVVTGSQVRVYANGEEIGSTEHGADSLASSSAPVLVGGNSLKAAVKSSKALTSAIDAQRVRRGFSRVPGSAVLWLTYDDVSDTAVTWRDEYVPGQWAYDGFSIPESPSEWYPSKGTLGWYRRTFRVPDGWDEGRLKLRFGAVYSEAHVFVNGSKVTEHVGGYTPFEVDVTDAVDPDGQNTLAVGVAQRSKADAMAWQNATGGILRDVTLFSVSQVNLADWYHRTELADNGSTATVTVDATVRNESAGTTDATVSVTLTGPDGSTAGTGETTVSGLSGGSSQDVTFEVRIDDPQTWNPERPRLYDLDIAVTAGGATERVAERVGLRTIEVDGDTLRVNGEAVTLRGVNWEEVHLAQYGLAVPEAITRQDAAMLKAMNVNYVRTAHAPTSEAFVEACDEFGIIVEDEAPHTFLGGFRSDPYPDVIVQQTLEMVERDKNHPSVCVWSVANESTWHEVFDRVARMIDGIDPSRPKIFNAAEIRAAPYLENYDIHPHHYPGFRAGSAVDELTGLDRPILFDEYGHLYCYNDRELVTDPGLRDQWIEPFEAVWEAMRTGDSVAGGAIWAGGDHLERWGQYLWGALDRYRRARPEYWHVKKAYAPVRVTNAEWNSDGSSVSVTIENRNSFVDLAERAIEVTSGDSTTELGVEAAPGERASVTLDAPGDEVEITVSHPGGYVVNWVVLSPEREPPATPSEASASPSTTDGAVEVSTDAYTLRVARSDGTIELASSGSDPVVVGAPDLALTPVQSASGRNYRGASAMSHRPAGRSVTDVSADGSTVAIEIEYESASGTIELQPLDTGIDVSYDFTLSGSIAAREAGVVLPGASDLRTLSWEREGRWSAYPPTHIGREVGSAEAFPGFSTPDHGGIRLDPSRPWKDDASRMGSNDFRSTKRNVYAASLSTDDRGFSVLSDGSQHVRAQVREEAVDLLVLDRSIGGTNADDWLNRHPVTGESTTLGAGTSLQGNAVLDLSGSTVAPAEARATPSPSEVSEATPTVTSTATPTPTPTPTAAGPTPTATEEDRSPTATGTTDTGGQPGMGIAAALAGLAGGGYLYARQRDDEDT